MVFLHYVFQDRPSDHWHRTLVQGLKAQLNEGWPEVIVRTLRTAQVATLGQKLQQPVRRAASEPGSRTHRPEVGGTLTHGLQDIQTPGQGLCPRRWRVNRPPHSGAVSCHVLLLGSYPHTSPRTSDPIPIMRMVFALSGQDPHLVRESRVTGPLGHDGGPNCEYNKQHPQPRLTTAAGTHTATWYITESRYLPTSPRSRIIVLTYRTVPAKYARSSQQHPGHRAPHVGHGRRSGSAGPVGDGSATGAGVGPGTAPRTRAGLWTASSASAHRPQQPVGHRAQVGMLLPEDHGQVVHRCHILGVDRSSHRRSSGRRCGRRTP